MDRHEYQAMRAKLLIDYQFHTFCIGIVNCDIYVVIAHLRENYDCFEISIVQLLTLLDNGVTLTKNRKPVFVTDKPDTL